MKWLLSYLEEARFTQPCEYNTLLKWQKKSNSGSAHRRNNYTVQDTNVLAVVQFCIYTQCGNIFIRNLHVIQMFVLTSTLKLQMKNEDLYILRFLSCSTADLVLWGGNHLLIDLCHNFEFVSLTYSPPDVTCLFQTMASTAQVEWCPLHLDIFCTKKGFFCRITTKLIFKGSFYTSEGSYSSFICDFLINTSWLWVVNNPGVSPRNQKVKTSHEKKLVPMIMFLKPFLPLPLCIMTLRLGDNNRPRANK